jgi:hypothetical protein
MAATPIEIPIKLNGLAAIKAELRELKGELANATDPKQMQELAMRAGELKDQLADANEQVAVFASGSKFEQVSNSFGSMKDSLMSLDFEEAAGKAKMFQQTLGSISPATIGNGIKGLISVVGSLTKAFIQFGISLLANPIFLLVAAIVAIVAVIALVMNKLGILKPILNAVGKVFGWIGDAIDMVVQAFKDLCDWLGLSNNAAEDAADKQAAAAEKTAAAYEEKSKSVVNGFDREIEMAKLDGKNTVYMEKQKQYWLLKTAAARLEAIKQKMIAARLSGDLDEEEILALRKSYNEQREVVKDSMHQIEVIDKTEANRKKDEAKKQSDENSKNAKSNADKQKEINDKKVEAEKKYQADRLAAARMYQDLDMQLMDEGVKKELKASQIAYNRLIEDTQNKYNEKTTHTKKEQEENIKLIEMYGLLAGDARDKINQKEIDKEKEKNAAIAAKQIEQQDLLWAMKEAANQTAKEKEVADLVEKSEADLLALGSSADAEIFVAEQTKIKLAEIDAKYAEIDLAAQRKVTDAKLAIAKEFTDSVNGLAQNIFAVTNSLGNQDVKAVEARAKRQFNINKAISIASATVEGIRATIAAFRNGMSNPIPLLGPATGAIYAAGAGIFAAANVAKIASTKYGGGGGGSVAPPAMNAPTDSNTSTQAATPNVNLFGANNNANTFGANGQQQGGQMVVKAIVVESDVTSVQNKMSKIQQSAVL